MDNNYLEQWARSLIEDWRAEVKKRRIRSRGILEASFKHTVIKEAGGNVEKIKFAYQWWGKMVKLGVGKGQKLDDIKDNRTLRQLSGKKGRVPKNWKDAPFNQATQELYAESFRTKRREIRESLDLAGRLEMDM